MANDRQQPIDFESGLIVSDQTAMQVLITRACFDDEVVDPSGSNAAQTDGDDQRFYKNDDQTGQIERDLVSFEHDTSTGAGDAICATWTKEDALVLSATADTRIFMEYGDAALSAPGDTSTFGRDNVWNDHLSMLHLVESGNGTSGEYVDSTGGTLTGQGGGGTAGDAPAQVTTDHPWGDTWQDFDGSVDWVLIENSTSAMDSSDGFASAWAFVDVNGSADEGIVSNRDSSDNTNFFQITDDSSGTLMFINDGTENVNATRGTAIGTTNTTHTAMSWSGSRVTSYHDGAQDQEDTTLAGDGQFSNAFDVRIGTYFDGGANRSINGRIGEVRLMLSQPSDDRIAVEYANQNDPGAFGVAGTPVAIGAGVTVPIFDHHNRMMAA